MQIELADIVKLYNRIDELEKRVAQLEEKVNTQQTISYAERPAFPNVSLHASTVSLTKSEMMLST